MDIIRWIHKNCRFAANQTFDSELLRWFGNSVVRTKDGMPRPVYHGTEAGSFNEFNFPTFFSASRSEAQAYSRITDVDEIIDHTYVSPSQAPKIPEKIDVFQDVAPVFQDVVIPNKVYLEDGSDRLFFWDGKYNPVGDKNIKIISNMVVEKGEDGYYYPVPGTTNDPKYESAEEVSKRQLLYSVYLSIQNPVHLDWQEANILGARLGAKEEEVMRLRDKWIQQGFDGIQTESDEGRFFGNRSIPQWIPFYPNQIKITEQIPPNQRTNQGAQIND
jgi:hypothetical protein